MNSDAARSVLAVLPAGSQRVEVMGDGGLADELRVLLRPDGVATDGGPPAAIVDTTGDQELIEDALRRVDDLGTVVLAGPPGLPMALDLYSDVHVRGLTVVGVNVGASGSPSTPAA